MALRPLPQHELANILLKSQIVNMLDFVSQEAKSRLLSRYLYNQRENKLHIFIDKIQNNCPLFLCDIDLPVRRMEIFLDSNLLHWSSKLMFPNIEINCKCSFTESILSSWAIQK